MEVRDRYRDLALLVIRLKSQTTNGYDEEERAHPEHHSATRFARG
jgi:hypothetical protein